MLVSLRSQSVKLIAHLKSSTEESVIIIFHLDIWPMQTISTLKPFFGTIFSIMDFRGAFVVESKFFFFLGDFLWASSYPSLIYAIQVNSTFHTRWLACSEVISEKHSPLSSRRDNISPQWIIVGYLALKKIFFPSNVGLNFLTTLISS